MKRIYRPASNTYFVCHGNERRGERFLIEIDDTKDIVIAEHIADGFRRPLGLTVAGAKWVAGNQGWREVTGLARRS